MKAEFETYSVGVRALKMTNTNSQISRQSGGVRHPPEADIESIRDLLRGYGLAGSILKELIQNAEDAGASRMDVICLPGNTSSPLSLLRSPGLLVANNGRFTEEHRKAISQINLGTKGTEQRAIGRFGKGLKSVFAWCEAFYIVARTDRNLGWSTPAVTDLFNPWHGWRHSTWEEEFDQFGEIILGEVERHLEICYPRQESWLALWLPLRETIQVNEDLPEKEWIVSRFPAEDPGFYEGLCSELRSLAPSLVSLRALQEIALRDHRGSSPSSAILRFSPESKRIPAASAPAGPVTLVNGAMDILNFNHRGPTFKYCGLAGRLPSHQVQALKESSDWPEVVLRTREQNSASRKAKGEPEFATLIAWTSTDGSEASGSLDVRWCVFFPIGKQPPGKLPIPLPTIGRQITINLHGFFFLDSDRLRIDGLEDRFALSNATPSKSCLEWNSLVATHGSLAHLTEALATFAEAESLNNIECRELAGALLHTWVWQEFSDAICSRRTWRPRWKSGLDNWECIDSSSPVFVIPQLNSSRSVLTRIPNLARISEEVALVATDANGVLAGIHCDRPNAWPEDIALQIFEDVELATTGDEATANWLNAFLTLLSRQSALTPAILERAKALPLLPVQESNTGVRLRISAVSWTEKLVTGRLFSSDSESTRWIGMLRHSLPDWSCHISNVEPPEWLNGPRVPVCDATRAAEIVLGQELVGGFAHRARLVDSFASSLHRDSRMILAMRYLMHTDPLHRFDRSKTLFMPSTQHEEQIWPLLIQQLLAHEGGSDSWRLLHDLWAPILSPQGQQELGVSTIDAISAWTELRKVQAELSLEFPSSQWSTNDICALMQGLFQAAQSLRDNPLPTIRRLAIHTLRGRPDERVSIADSVGNLASGCVLNAPTFEAELTPHLRSIWQSFLSETRIVELISSSDLASKVQRDMFMVDLDDTTYSNELDWSFVVRHSLDSTFPSEWAPLIMEGISRQGGQAIRGVGQKFRETKWLPLVLGGTIAPEYVVYIEGLDEELHRLLDPEKDGWGSIRSLPEWITNHDGFGTLRNMLPVIEKALEAVGLWLDDKPLWHLGLSKRIQMHELEPLLAPLENSEELPVAALLIKLQQTTVRGAREDINSLLSKYVLPSILKAFDYLHGGLERIDSILRGLQRGPNRVAFDAYLEQAYEDGIIETLLPDLSLVNQRGQWVSARKLIWPSANLNPAAQLCSQQSEILSSLHQRSDFGASEIRCKGQGDSLVRANQLTEPPDFEFEANKLSQFLQPFRVGNVGENLPAALVAVLAGDAATQMLLRELLQAGLRRHPSDFLAQLLGEKTDDLAPSVNSERFLIEIVRGESAIATNILGEQISVEFTKEIASLLVGDPSVLWRRYYYQSRPETACHLLRLRWIESPDDLSDRVAVFASTIETILLKVHCNGISNRCPSNIKEVLHRIADAGQADLRRSQSYLLDMAEGRLKELSVTRAPEFRSILRKFAQARDRSVDAEELLNQAPSLAKQCEEDAKGLVVSAKLELRRLLESRESGDAQLTLVEAVRRKMKEFQYGLSSVAFELFQNADDAVAELEEMQNGLEDQCRRQFVVELDSEEGVLQIIHWGRPINRYEYPGFERGQELGFDQDLQKMLTLNFSDKGLSSEGSSSIVTGRFGLGFKSVFFISDCPQVISGRLAFEIRGGFFPVSLPPNVSEEMRIKAGRYGGPEKLPTVIRLRWAKETLSNQMEGAMLHFARVAPMLTVFSRQIRCLVVSHDSNSQTWTVTEKKLTATGRAIRATAGGAEFLCFRCLLHSDRSPATVLFKSDPNGISPLPDDLTGLWITTPTAERSDLKYALNAPFKPDAGRQQLALNNSENLAIAAEIARLWGEALIELFNETQERWSQFAEAMELHANATFGDWWQRLWKTLTEFSPVVQWGPIEDGNCGQIMSWIAWAKSIGAMRALVQRKPAIPSELPGCYAQMLMLSDVRFYVVGLLARIGNGCFAHIARWNSTQAAFPPGKTVLADVADYLRRAEFTISAEVVNLERVLSVSVGPKCQVSPLLGEQLGSWFSQFKSLVEQNPLDGPEIRQLLNWVTQLRFLGKDGIYHSATELVCARALSEVIEADEALRAHFAPGSSTLSDEYSEMALRMFVKARERLAAGAPLLASWAIDVSPDTLPAVFRYLVRGELGQQLADVLKRPWLEARSDTSAWRDLSPADRHEIERKFSRWNPSVSATILFSSPVQITQVMDEEEAFQLVSRWWQEERSHWMTIYEERTYPIGFPGALPWPGEDEWDVASDPSAQARWLILFIHAALVPLGFNNIGRDQSFSQFLVSKRWLEILAKSSTEPRALLGALDDYLDGSVQYTEYHFQMRQFVAFYAVARNLESLLLSLREAERSSAPDSFNSVFSPRINPALAGTGIDAPPLLGMLGIGSCQLLRELYRLKRLINPLGHRFAYTPLRKVRRLCTLLFGIPEGSTAAQSSGIIFDSMTNFAGPLSLDPTFHRCFDLPLQFLAQDDALRTRVLGRRIAIDSPEENLDAEQDEVSSLWNL
jgi:hypothetical protein